MGLMGKSFYVSLQSNKKHNLGEVINLMQVDTMRIQWVTWYLAAIIFMPLQLGVAIYMLFRFIGISFLAGVGVIILTVFCNIFIGRKLFLQQSLLMKAKDERTKSANELFQQIKFIKVNAFEDYFTNKLFGFRNKEQAIIIKRFTMSCLNILSIWLSPMLILNSTFALYVYLGNPLTPANTFAIISLFQVLQGPLFMVPMSLNSLIEANISIQRIQKFLLTTEIMTRCIKHQEYPAKDSIVIENGNFYWYEKGQSDKQIQADKKKENDKDSKKGKPTKPKQIEEEKIEVKQEEEEEYKPILANIDLKVKSGSFVAIIGEYIVLVGSGKTSILQAILGEMIYVDDSVPKITINGKIAYVSQKTWIQNASVKDNILFGLPFDEKKYHNAIHYSCLEQDIKILIKGDSTMIGEKGVNLSGGQKARVSLARAIYSDSDIYLLDDPISAVDVHVGKFIMHQCLNGYLKSKTRVLITHALNYLQYIDVIYLMDNGSIGDSGTFSEIKNSPKFQMIYEKFYKQKIKEEEEVIDDDQNEEEMLNKFVEKEIQLFKKQSSKMPADDGLDKKTSDPNAPKDEIDELMLVEDREKGSISFATFYQYFSVNGGFWFFFIIIFLLFVWSFAQVASSLWMANWAEQSELHKDNLDEIDNNFYLEIYSCFSLSFGFLAFFRSWILVTQSCRSATKIHNKMVKQVTTPFNFKQLLSVCSSMLIL